MIQINKSDRQKLEELGVLKQTQYGIHGMQICSKQKCSNAKSIYVEDWMTIFLNPDIYRNAMRKYLSQGKIENDIKNVLRGNYQVY